MHNIRHRYAISARSHKNNNRIRIGSKLLINFCSNDYLALSTHPALKKAFIQGVSRYGVGSGASSIVSGYYAIHQACEEKFAEFLQQEKALLFSSGYLANVGVVSALIDRHAMIIADKLCHASLLDGMQLSRARILRYRHQDFSHLRTCIAQTKAITKRLFITEGVFSMEGDITPLPQMIALLKSAMQKNSAMLMVDDAHAIGVLGEQGRGSMEYFQLASRDVSCLIAPLGKAFASIGAIVAGSAALIDEMMQQAKSYWYNTALPPALAGVAIAALKIVSQENWRREQLKARIAYFNLAAKERGLPLVSPDLTPIKSILLKNVSHANLLKIYLLAQGFYVSCITAPSVPLHAPRLRVSLNCNHTETEIEKLLDAVVAITKSLKKLEQ